MSTDTIIVRYGLELPPTLSGELKTMGLQSLGFEKAETGRDMAQSLLVSVERLDAQQRRQLRREPAVVALGTAMPLSLIEPVTRAEVADGESEVWGIGAVGADTSPWDGAGVKVAVLDTGIDRSHDAFKGLGLDDRNILDFTGEGGGMGDDDDGHGTHCAATIFGRAIGGKRIGVAPGVNDVLICKVMGQRGGSSAMLIRAIEASLAQGMDIISMSLGFDFQKLVNQLNKAGWPDDLALSTALQSFRNNLDIFNAMMTKIAAIGQGGFGIAGYEGSLVVAATGNESRVSGETHYRLGASLPAASAGVHAVGALARAASGQWKLADFSNGGAAFCAPGVDIVSARAGGGLISMSGTSMATPHVAGVAALWAQKLKKSNKKNLPRAIASRLDAEASAEAIEGTSSAEYGEGMIRAPS